MIAALVPGGHNRQIRGHFQGLTQLLRSQLTIGALNFGATREEIRVVRDIAVRMCREAGVKWKTPIVNLD